MRPAVVTDVTLGATTDSGAGTTSGPHRRPARPRRDPPKGNLGARKGASGSALSTGAGDNRGRDVDDTPWAVAEPGDNVWTTRGHLALITPLTCTYRGSTDVQAEKSPNDLVHVFAIWDSRVGLSTHRPTPGLNGGYPPLMHRGRGPGQPGRREAAPGRGHGPGHRAADGVPPRLRPASRPVRLAGTVDRAGPRAPQQARLAATSAPARAADRGDAVRLEWSCCRPWCSAAVSTDWTTRGESSAASPCCASSSCCSGTPRAPGPSPPPVAPSSGEPGPRRQPTTGPDSLLLRHPGAPRPAGTGVRAGRGEVGRVRRG